MMLEVPADAAVTDPVAASVEEPMDSGVDPDSSPGITSFSFSLLCLFLLLPLTDIFCSFCQLTRQRIPMTLSHPWMQLLMMLRMSSWRQKVFLQSSKKVKIILIFDFFFDKIMYSYLFVFLLLADYEATEEVPPSSSVPEQEVPVADPEVEASSAGFDATGVKPQAETSSSASSVGRSLLITLPPEHE